VRREERGVDSGVNLCFVISTLHFFFWSLDEKLNRHGLKSKNKHQDRRVIKYIAQKKNLRGAPLLLPNLFICSFK
jgi:hypothetical protein